MFFTLPELQFFLSPSLLDFSPCPCILSMITPVACCLFSCVALLEFDSLDVFMRWFSQSSWSGGEREREREVGCLTLYTDQRGIKRGATRLP